MSIALAQSSLGTHTSFAYTNASGGSSSVSVSLGNTSAGSLLLIAAYYHTVGSGTTSPTGFLTPTGGSGLSWQSAQSGGFNSGSDRGNAVIYVVGNASAQTTPTFSLTITVDPGSGNGTSFAEATAYEFTGTAASNSASVGGALIDTNGSLLTQTASTPHTNNLTTTQTDLIIAAFAGTGSAISAGSGFTLGQTASNISGVGQLQYALNVASGSIATSFSGTQALWGCRAIAFKPGAATGGASYGFFFG